MRISNLLPAVCATALIWGGLAAAAQDNPAQAAARAALMEKMSQMNAQPSQPAKPDLAPIVMTPSSTAAEKPAQPVKAAASSPLPVSPKPAEAKRAPATAVASTPVPMADDSGFSPVPPPSNPNVLVIPQVVVVPAPAVSSTAAVTNQSPKSQQPAAKPAAKPTTPAKQAAPEVTHVAKPALPDKKLVKETAPAVKPPPPANVNYPGKGLGFDPIVAPPPPVSEQKQAELQALLAKYQANQISPDDYQKARAAILAEP